MVRKGGQVGQQGRGTTRPRRSLGRRNYRIGVALARIRRDYRLQRVPWQQGWMEKRRIQMQERAARTVEVEGWGRQ